MPQGVPGVPIGSWLVAILFLALLAGGAWLLLRFVRQGQGAAGFGGPGPLRVVARVPVAMNQAVLLVRVADHLLVLGAGQRIDLLERIDDPELVAELDPGSPAGEGTGSDFRQLFDQSLRRLKDSRTLGRGGRDA